MNSNFFKCNFNNAKQIYCLFLVLLIQFCTKLNAQELYTVANAASAANEYNSIVGLETGNTDVIVEQEDVYRGNYAIKLLANSDGWQLGKILFSTTTNVEYRIRLYAKSVGGQRSGFYLWEGFSDFVGSEIEGTSWKKYEFVFTANSNQAVLKFYTGHPSIIGDAILIDEVSIMEVDNQAPQPPVLTLLRKSSTTANLSWSGATDNSGVSAYKVYKNGVLEQATTNESEYQSNNLLPNTSYEYKLKAVDFYGNESSFSNTLTVTTDSNGNGTESENWNSSNTTVHLTDDTKQVALGVTTVPTGYKLAVDGKLITEEVKVQLRENWPDYVFSNDYTLLSIKELEAFIQKEKHLPNIPSAEAIHKNGLELGEMNRLLLEKIEELTLHIIQLNTEVQQLKQATAQKE
ncbi:fibronectin type III domain-containing protein [Croceivirga radicis]|uniref:fibronectin type III domain-containing protein n=1 Tax=Croceivirga radicis TaxID=1929488 RepID=UPI000255B309|nr:fibronectin type III domain-containing protein [Croceivirga radicis]